MGVPLRIFGNSNKTNRDFLKKSIRIQLCIKSARHARQPVSSQLSGDPRLVKVHKMPGFFGGSLVLTIKPYPSQGISNKNLQ